MIRARWEAPCRLRITGHAGWAPAGQDVVCAAVSALWGTLEAELRRRERCGQGRLTAGPDVLAFAPERPYRREIETLFAFVWRGVAAVAVGYPHHVRAERAWQQRRPAAGLPGSPVSPASS